MSKRSILALVLVTGCAADERIGDAQGGPSGRVDMTAPDTGPDILFGATIKSLRVAQDEGSHLLEFTAEREGLAYFVAIKEIDFDKSRHRVEDRDGNAYIDGGLAIGTDGALPLTEIEKFEVAVAGKRIDVPPELFRDCYNLWIGQKSGSINQDYRLVVRVLEDGTLLLSLMGADGAGTYLVHWWLGGVRAPDRLILYDEEPIFDHMERWQTAVPERPRTLIAPEDAGKTSEGRE